ncbi:hypothetical protein EGI22_02250 [Lacihabitans sp. LS3-19]|uniref:hypothetical protein n=1 Tax=Lacihabitans sp. LS3-19 TaxID=2487335 RepID=UPI0020CF951C|nr:hypothetical protein [Lacihabitans sp. LS3-19]MCP9766713.1 hypothetical protein [Lacihabitans sp. LS3-19]
MAVNQKQIEEIEAFVKSKYVEYYDIQVELVDHLASAIETELEQFPNQDFEKVLLSKYKAFGIFGFSDFVEERAMAVYSDSRKKYWKQFFAFFKIPKFVYTALIYVLFYLLFTFYPSIHPVVILGSVFIPLGLYTLIFFQKMKKDLTHKLVQKTYQPFWISISGSFLNLNNIVFNDKNKEYFWYQPWFLAAIVTFFIIGVWAESTTHKNIHVNLRSQYPEAFKTT